MFYYFIAENYKFYINYEEIINSHVKSGAIATMGIKQIAKEEIPKFGQFKEDESVICMKKEF